MCSLLLPARLRTKQSPLDVALLTPRVRRATSDRGRALFIQLPIQGVPRSSKEFGGNRNTSLKFIADSSQLHCSFIAASSLWSRIGAGRGQSSPYYFAGCLTLSQGPRPTMASVSTSGSGAHPPNELFLAYSPKCLEDEFSEVHIQDPA